MKVKAVFFDVDGTLVDMSAVVEAIQETMIKWGFEPLSTKVILQKVVGIPLKIVMPLFYPITTEQGAQFSQDYHKEYNKRHVATYLPHAKEVLQKLKDKKIKIALITTKSRATGLKTIKELRIPHDLVITQDDVRNLKPHPEPINKALKEFKIQPSEAIMVGDHNFDVDAANKAGCVSVAIDTGARTKKELMKSKPDYLIHDLKEILEIIK